MTKANARIQISTTQVKAGVFAFALALSVGVRSNPAFAQQTDDGTALRPYQPVNRGSYPARTQPGISYQGNFAPQANNGMDLRPYQPVNQGAYRAPVQPGASYQGNPYVPNIAGAVQQAGSFNQNPIQPGVSYQAMPYGAGANGGNQIANRADNQPIQPGVSYQGMSDGSAVNGKRHKRDNQPDNRADNQPYQPGLAYQGGVPYGAGANGNNGGNQPDNRADNQPDQAGASYQGMPYGGGPNGGGANGGEPPNRADNEPIQAGAGLPPGMPFSGGPSGGGPHRPYNPLPPHGPAIPKPGYDTSWSFPPAPPKPCPHSDPVPPPTPPPPIIPGDSTTTLRNPYINGEQVTPPDQAPDLGQPEAPGNGDNWFGVNPGMGGGPLPPASAIYIPPMGAYDKDAVNAMVQPYLTPPAPTPDYDPGMLPGPGGLQNPGPVPPAALVNINADGDPTMPGDYAPRTRWSAQTTRDLGYPKSYGSQLNDFGQNPKTLSGVNWSISKDGPRPFVFPGALNATTNRDPNLAGAQVTQDLNGNRTLFMGPAPNKRAQMTLIPTPPATH